MNIRTCTCLLHKPYY